MPRQLTIGERLITDETRCFVIAEVGHNHQGDMAQAHALVDAAHQAGADAVKLQKRDNRALFTRAYYEQTYNSENAFGETYGEHREALELDGSQYRELQAHASDLGLLFFATAFDIPSADFLDALDVPAIKIASGDLTNTPLLRYVAKLERPIVLSTGGGTIEDVERAFETVHEVHDRLSILQCTAGYPPAFDELNLGVITTYRERFPDTVIGLSSHDSGIAMALVGYTMGARIIEKHFTLNRALKGTDHAFSLEPVGLRKLVRDLERAHTALGDGRKVVYESERAPVVKMSKSIVAARDLPAGHTLSESDLAMKSPGGGLPPYEVDSLLGRRTNRALSEDELLTLDGLDDA